MGCVGGRHELVNFRHRRGVGGFIYYGISADSAVERYCWLLVNGVRPSDIHITEGDIGDAGRRLQGEIELGCPLYLFYSRLQMVMRPALEQGGLHAFAGDATRILKTDMDRPSYDNFLRLQADYPDHVIEFTTYREPVGVLGWNTVFWEVRAY